VLLGLACTIFVGVKIKKKVAEINMLAEKEEKRLQEESKKMK
jgi:hypothetical protein